MRCGPTRIVVEAVPGAGRPSAAGRRAQGQRGAGVADDARASAAAWSPWRRRAERRAVSARLRFRRQKRGPSSCRGAARADGGWTPPCSEEDDGERQLCAPRRHARAPLVNSVVDSRRGRRVRHIHAAAAASASLSAAERHAARARRVGTKGLRARAAAREPVGTRVAALLAGNARVISVDALHAGRSRRSRRRAGTARAPPPTCCARAAAPSRAPAAAAGGMSDGGSACTSPRSSSTDGSAGAVRAPTPAPTTARVRALVPVLLRPDRKPKVEPRGRGGRRAEAVTRRAASRPRAPSRRRTSRA